jgi:hypothetical protein
MFFTLAPAPHSSLSSLYAECWHAFSGNIKEEEKLKQDMIFVEFKSEDRWAVNCSLERSRE